MAGARAKNDSCWTCRLRRKKCDGARPLCGGCGALEIRCYSTAAKPPWMDGGAEQEQMAESIKAQIKGNASGRRARQLAQGPEKFVITSAADYSAGPSSASPSRHENESAASNSAPSVPAASHPRQAPTESDIDSAILGFTALRFPDVAENDKIQPPATSPLSLVTVGPYGELALVVKYIDYVFPYLFPYHRFPVFSTGRSFLLATLMENKIIYLSVLSVSWYYFIATLNSYTPHEPDVCRSHAWHDIGVQMTASFKLIHREMEKIARHQQDVTIKERRGAMESIVQLMIFITALGRPNNWNMHLNAAINLFRDILALTSSPNGPSMENGMDDISKHFPNSPWKAINVWSPDQVAFRFYAGVLAFMDIIASTSLDRSPELQEHYSHLLAEGDDGVTQGENIAPLQFSILVGCQNWALVAIGETAGLSMWKKNMKKAGSLSLRDLHPRAERIAASLRQGLARLAASDPDELKLNISIVPTRIWALAAQAYLTTVVSGWMPRSPVIRVIVAEGLSLIRNIQGEGALRSFAWPLCVLGCMVDTESQEQEIRDMVDGLGKLKDFGSLPEALRLMEVVWRSRDMLDTDTWDIASCLTVLNEPAILI